MFGGELATAGGGECVEAGAAIFGGGAPLGADPFFLEETLESGIERTVIDLESVGGSLLDEFGDAVTVERSPTESAKDDEVESALHDVEAFLMGAGLGRHG